MNAATFLRLVSTPSSDGPQERGLLPNPGHSNAKAALARRRQREKMFEDAHIADGPAWEMLVDLYISEIEGKCLCIGSLCVTSGVPMTNAVRILGKLLDKGLVCREPDPEDRRRCFIALRPDTRAKLNLYFSSS